MKQIGKVMVAVDDMFFAAKILSAARQVGRDVERVTSRVEVEQAVEKGTPALLIIDLNSMRLEPIATIEYFKARSALASIPILGFLSHVQIELKRRAERAGCDLVLPRSAFSQRLAEILSGHLL
jgi:CheY-like chemotaxis protein